MRLEHVEFENFGTFESRSFELDAPFIGVFGKNGSGKSTLVEGIYSALTGDFRRYGTLTEYVHDTAGGNKSNSGSVKLTLTHGDVRLVVKRTISVSAGRGTQTARLKITDATGDTESISGVTNVNSRLRLILGEELGLAGQIAFVQQGALTELITKPSAARTALFHRLFGLDRFETIWSKLGEAIGKIPELTLAEKPEDLMEECRQLRASLLDAAGRLSSVNAQIDTLRVNEANADIERWYILQNDSREAVRLSTELAECNRQLNELQDALGSLESAAKDANGQLEGVKPLRGSLVASLAKLNEAVAMAQRRDDVQRRVGELINSMQELREPPKPTATWSVEEEVEFQRLTNEISVCGEALVRWGERSGPTTCPTCDSIIADVGNLVKQYKSRLDAARTGRASMAGRRAETDTQLKQYDMLLAVYASNKMRLLDETERLTKQYAALSTASTESTAECQAKIADLTAQHLAVSNQCHTLETKLSWLTADIASKSELQRKSLQRRALLTETLALTNAKLTTGIPLTEAHIENCRQRVKAASDLLVQHARLTETSNQVEQQIKIMEARVERAQVLKARIDLANSLRSDLQLARSVFHRQALPAELAGRWLRATDGYLRKFMDSFDTGFTASIEQLDGEYNFKCAFNDGTMRSGNSLSGGEKACLSIGLLLSLNEAISKKLGMLSLDEPTAEMDDDNIGRLNTVLQGVKRYASNTGVQIIVITHSKLLSGVFDQVIDLDAELN